MRLDSGEPSDYSIFGPTGAALLRGQLTLVFASPNNAGGPFELPPYGVAYVLRIHGDVAWTTFYTVVLTLLMFALALVLLSPLGRTVGRRSF
jgi:hypothetical protein